MGYKIVISVVAIVSVLITSGYSFDAFAIQTATPIGTVSCDGFDITEPQAHEALDEFVGSPDDGATKISSGMEGVTCRVNIGSFEDPEIHTGHTIHFRAQATGGGQGEKIIVKLFDGDIQVAASPKITIDRNIWDNYTYTLPTADPNNIANYTNLRIELEISAIGNSESLEITQTYLEVPDRPEPRGTSAQIKEILDLQEGFYKISHSVPDNTKAVGVLGDCNVEGQIVPDNRCVFSVDSVRYMKPQQDDFLADAGPVFSHICIDHFSDSGSPKMYNCSMLTSGEVGYDLGQDVKIKVGPLGTIGTGVEGGAEIKGGIAFGFGVGGKLFDLSYQRQIGEWNRHLIGGNVLIDTGMGAVTATDYVVLAHGNYLGPVEFLGSKPANMKIIFGYQTDNGEQQCWEYDENDTLKESNDGCPEVFSEVLDLACLSCASPSSGSSSLKANPQVEQLEEDSRITNIISVSQLRQDVLATIDEVKDLNKAFKKFAHLDTFSLDNEIPFFIDLIEKDKKVSSVSTIQTSSNSQTIAVEEEFTDLLIDLLIFEYENKQKHDQRRAQIILALAGEDLSGNLNLVSDIDKRLKDLEQPLENIKDDLVSLGDDITKDLKDNFASLKSTLEGFWGPLS